MNFEIINDLTRPCPICFAPACGRDYQLYYIKEETKMVLVFDASVLSSILSVYFKKHVNESNCETQSTFIKEWVACEGWEDCYEVAGYELNTIDFLQVLNGLEEKDFDEHSWWEMEGYLREMKAVANVARELGVSLFILD